MQPRTRLGATNGARLGVSLLLTWLLPAAAAATIVGTSVDLDSDWFDTAARSSFVGVVSCTRAGAGVGDFHVEQVIHAQGNPVSVGDTVRIASDVSLRQLYANRLDPPVFLVGERSIVVAGTAPALGVPGAGPGPGYWKLAAIRGIDFFAVSVIREDTWRSTRIFGSAGPSDTVAAVRGILAMEPTARRLILTRNALLRELRCDRGASPACREIAESRDLNGLFGVISRHDAKTDGVLWKAALRYAPRETKDAFSHIHPDLTPPDKQVSALSEHGGPGLRELVRMNENFWNDFVARPRKDQAASIRTFDRFSDAAFLAAWRMSWDASGDDSSDVAVLSELATADNEVARTVALSHLISRGRPDSAAELRRIARADGPANLLAATLLARTGDVPALCRAMSLIYRAPDTDPNRWATGELTALVSNVFKGKVADFPATAEACTELVGARPTLDPWLSELHQSVLTNAPAD